MQAIHTYFVPLTDKYPCNRVKARANAGSIIIEWDDEADIPTNHANAAAPLHVYARALEAAK